MKRLSIMLAFVLFSQILFSQKTNFTGNWNLNPKISDFGSVPLFTMPVQIKVEQKKDSIYLTGLNVDESGQKKEQSARYSLDGKTMEREYSGGMLAGYFKYSEDQKQLLKHQDYFMAASTDGKPIRIINETWTLSEDGKKLTIAQHVDVANFDPYSIKGVYELK
jgi:hypothetical protein